MAPPEQKGVQMAITYNNFSQMMAVAMSDPGHARTDFWKAFSKFIRMANYLKDVSAEAYRIVKEYDLWFGVGSDEDQDG